MGTNSSKPVFIRKPKNWTDLHPAPRVAVEEKNCCDCIFAESKLSDGKIFCTMKMTYMNSYDECGAFTRKNSKD